jgi:predicted phosphohydrolase
MSLYAIGDLHLSFGSDKPMDIFGPKWAKHSDKLLEGFKALQPEDVCVICGDLSWAMSMEEAAMDFRFIESLPGKKIILKGNHDYWWSTASKAKAFFVKEGIKTIDILHNNCYFYENYALCGSRGWFCEEECQGHDRKIMNRELMRIEASLKAAQDINSEATKLCFLHYPPKYGSYECTEISTLFHRYNVKLCCYGHLHGSIQKLAFNGRANYIEYRLVAADFVDFKPFKIL